MRYLYIFLILLISSNAAADLCSDEYDKFSKQHIALTENYDGTNQKTRSELLILKQKIEKTIDNCRKSARLHTLAAWVCVSLEQNAEASRFAQKAVEINPDSWESNDVYGNSLVLLGKYDLGLSYLEKATRLAPDKLYLLMNLCSSYEDAKQYQKAITTCTEVISKKTNEFDGPAYYVRGRAYNALKMKDKADSDFVKAKALNFDGDQYYKDEHHGTN